MKRIDLLDALGTLDEKYTKEADARADALNKTNVQPVEFLARTADEPQNKGNRRPVWLRAMTGVAAAAVFALSVGTVAKVVQNARRTPGMRPGSSETGPVTPAAKNLFGGSGTLFMTANGILEDDSTVYSLNRSLAIDKQTGETRPFIYAAGEGILFSDGESICRADSSNVIHRVKSDGTEETLIDLKELENEENTAIRFNPELDVFYKVGENRWFISFGVTQTLSDEVVSQRVVCWVDMTTPGTIDNFTLFNGSEMLGLQVRFESLCTMSKTDSENLFLFKCRAQSDGTVFDNVMLFFNEPAGSFSSIFENVSTMSLFDVACDGGYYYYTEWVDAWKEDKVHIRLCRKPLDNTTASGEVLWDDCGIRKFSMKNGRIYTVDYSQNSDGEIISVKPDGSDKTVLMSGCGPALYDLRFAEQGGEFGGQYFVSTETNLVFCNPETGAVKAFSLGADAAETTADSADQTEKQTTETTAKQSTENVPYSYYNTINTDLNPWFSRDSDYQHQIDYSADTLPVQGAAIAELIGSTENGCILNVYIPEQNDRASVDTTGKFMLVKYADEKLNLLGESGMLKPDASSVPVTAITKQQQTLAVSWKADSSLTLEDGCFYGLAVQVREPETGNTDWFTVSLPPVMRTEQPVGAKLIGQDAERMYLTVKTASLASQGQTVAFVDRMQLPAPDGKVMYGPVFPDPSNAKVKIPYEDHVQVESYYSGVVQFYYPEYVEAVADDETLITVSWTNGIVDYTPSAGTHYLLTQVYYDDGTAYNEGMNARLLKQYYDNRRGSGADLENDSVILTFTVPEQNG